jgi:hypothetical protein
VACGHFVLLLKATEYTFGTASSEEPRKIKSRVLGVILNGEMLKSIGNRQLAMGKGLRRQLPVVYCLSLQPRY